ncbi:MAG: hypothetical protein Q7U18_00820 [Methylobacter sp.]|nr:hypothetical protein [Methylobacter sp.]
MVFKSSMLPLLVAFIFADKSCEKVTMNKEKLAVLLTCLHSIRAAVRGDTPEVYTLSPLKILWDFGVFCLNAPYYWNGLSFGI